MKKIFAADLQSSESICNGMPFCDAGGNAGQKAGELLGKGVNIFLMVCALIGMFYMFWGGLDWITSEGDKEKKAKARLKITHAVIGIVIVFSIWTLWALIVTKLGIFKESGNGGLMFEIPSLVK